MGVVRLDEALAVGEFIQQNEHQNDYAAERGHAIRRVSMITAAFLATLGLVSTAGAQEPTPGTATPTQARSTIEAPVRAKNLPIVRSEQKGRNPSAHQRLREELNKVLGSRHLLRGTTAVLAVDALSGDVLFSTNADKKLNPASNVKLFSTAAVLDVLGDDYRFKTRLVGATPDESGSVKGGVYLLGSGDPSFLADEVKRLAASAAARGIVTINGDVHLSDDQHRDTLGVPRVRLNVTGSRRPGRRPSISYSPQTEFVEIVNKAKTSGRRGRRSRLSVRGKLVTTDGVKKWVVTVSGRIGRRTGKTLRVAAPLRSTFTGHVVRSALLDAGIDVTGTIRIEDFDQFVARGQAAGKLPVELVTHESKPMSELVSVVNKYSVNHLADRLVMTAAAHEGDGRLSMNSAVATMHSFFERVGIDPKHLTIDTGSGLSYNTKLTATQIVDILRIGAGYRPGSRGSGESFIRSLSVGGVDGTLRGRLRGAHGSVVGKTGTLTSCHALSGFVLPKSGRPIAFAIVTNGNRRADRTAVRGEHEALVEAIRRHAPKVKPALTPVE